MAPCLAAGLDERFLREVQAGGPRGKLWTPTTSRLPAALHFQISCVVVCYTWIMEVDGAMEEVFGE